MTETAAHKRAPSYRASIRRAETPAELAHLLIAERARIRRKNDERPRGLRTCQAITAATDLLVQRLLEISLPEARADREHVRLAVIATGSYGRQELCPYSDIDVSFVAEEESTGALDRAVRRLFLSLMDVAQRVGLRVGYGYRTLDDAERLDHQTQNALLDGRYLGGDRQLFDDFVDAVRQHIWPGAFVRQKLWEREERLRRLEPTVYLIEPDVRESAGALRDLQLAQSLATVALPSARGDIWRQLARLGIISRGNVRQLRDAHEFLLTLRNWMHFDADRMADQLVRARQERLAVELGFEDDERASRVERFMERYYLHARAIQSVKGFVVDRCLEERLGLSEALACAGAELFRADPDANIATPAFLVDLFEQYQQHSLKPGFTIRRLLDAGLRRCPPLASDHEAAYAFLRLLRSPTDVHDTLQQMADLGALQRLIPTLGEAFDRVPMDIVHRHTIGHHSLQVVREIERLRHSISPSDDFVRYIWNGVVAPEELYLGALFHDAGKLSSAGDHAEVGADLARQVCRAMGLESSAVENIAFLVEHHLLMSHTAQYRDMTLPRTLQAFLDTVGSPQMLRMLALLTIGDMAATGVLTDIKRRYVQELYERAEAAMESAAPASDRDRARRHSRRLAKRLSSTRLTAEQIERYIEGMPVAYVLNTPPERVALHIEMMRALQAGDPSVELRQEEGLELTALHICTWEEPQPGLLSRIAGVLFAHDVAIHSAQVATRAGERPVALDTLWIDYQGRPLPPYKRMEVEQDLLAVLQGAPVGDVIARQRRVLPRSVAPQRVSFSNDLSEDHTMLELVTVDQPGLLYRITRAAARLGWNIHSARIGTHGDRARDALYITTAAGEKLTDAEAQLRESFLGEFMRE